MIQTYGNLLDKGSEMWENIIVVITKVSYEDCEDMGEWLDDMEKIKQNFKKAIKELDKEANPQVLTIS